MRIARAAIAATTFSLLLTACGSPRPQGPPTQVINRILASAPGKAQPSDIVAVEIAYGQDAKALGQFTAGENYAALGALLHTRNGPVDFAQIAPALKDSGVATTWEPRVVVMSCDGALALSQGRFEDQDGIIGNYVTVWARQDDGEYKWTYDVAGPDVPQPPPRFAPSF